MELIYKRIIIKISGEAISTSSGFGIDFKKTEKIAKILKDCAATGTQIAVVVGGGNFWRGRSSGNMDKVKADHMGMLATIINALAISDSIEKIGAKCVVQTSFKVQEISEIYTRDKAISHLQKGKIVIFAGGIGNPFFSTDTCASLRAAEIGAEIIFKSTKTSGVFDSDPETNPNAKKYDSISFCEILNKNLKIIDSTAASMCYENKIPMLIFSMSNPENILKALGGETIGTLVS